jgi:hypothetical protein
MSMIHREISGLVGAYIRAWFYGGIVGALFAVYMMSNSTGAVHIEGLHDEPVVDNCTLPTGSYRGIELPCYNQQCLEAFGYWTIERKSDVLKKQLAIAPDTL